MLKLTNYNVPATGYYLVKINKNLETQDGFEMPDESSELASGKIVASGDNYIINGDIFSLDFEINDIIVFKRHTGLTVEIQLEGEIEGSKYKILPFDSALLKIGEDNEKI